MDHDERELLEDIQDDVRENKVHAARTDERTKHIQNELQGLREERIQPLEEQVQKNQRRSQRNSVILGGLGSAGAIILTKLANLLHL